MGGNLDALTDPSCTYLRSQEPASYFLLAAFDLASELADAIPP